MVPLLVLFANDTEFKYNFSILIQIKNIIFIQYKRQVMQATRKSNFFYKIRALYVTLIGKLRFLSCLWHLKISVFLHFSSNSNNFLYTTFLFKIICQPKTFSVFNLFQTTLIDSNIYILTLRLYNF